MQTPSRGSTVSNSYDRPLSRRQLLRYGAAAGAAAAVGSVPGVGSAATRRLTALAATPKKGGTLIFARSVAPTQLDPANSIIAGDVYTLDKIMEPLFLTSPAGKLVPWLAESYTTSKDGLTWTFNLRPGVKFSDGSPLTPADVVFSIKREAANKNGPLSFLDFAIKTIKAQ